LPCIASLVKKNVPLPCHRFVPLFVTTFTRTEPLRPVSTEKLFTATRTSSTTSGFGVMLMTPLRCEELIVAESTMKLFDSVRAPFAFMATPYSLMKRSAFDCAYA
jgi:hypothetical protein